MPCPGDPGPRPSFIPLPDCARAVMKYLAYGQTIENVFYFYRTDGYHATELGALGAEMLVAWGHNIQTLLPTAIELVDITCTSTAVVDDEQVVTPVGSLGTSANAAFPDTGATFAIKFATGRSGRSYRGRMYWPLLQADSVVASALDSVSAGILIDAISGFFEEIVTTTDDNHVIASYQNDCEWREEAVHQPVLTYTYTDLNLDSQRRRLPGRGI